MKSVVLGHKGIQELIKYLKIKSSTLDEIVELIKIRLAEEGFDLLLMNAPTTDVDGNRVGTVAVEPYTDGYRICYKGEDVAYIEFGTGVVGLAHKYTDGEALAKVGWEYDIHGHGTSGWFYYSKRDGSLQYSRGGSAPVMPVYKTYLELSNKVYSIIQEVFNGQFN